VPRHHLPYSGETPVGSRPRVVDKHIHRAKGALGIGHQRTAYIPEPLPLETCSVPLTILERPSFPLEKSNRMVPLGKKRKISGEKMRVVLRGRHTASLANWAGLGYSLSSQ